ncbi:MAG TPA: hypothetical protein VNT26_20865, partial [Candidatus Sulfotelmatobacter sp.]|nr:hypothetical protein [Candidatus Sulfotelmatobacter sp.]
MSPQPIGKRFRIAFVLAIAVMMVAPFLVWVRQPKPVASGSLALPDGSLATIQAVTYGTNHVVGTPLARLVARLPATPQRLLTRFFGSRVLPRQSASSPNPALIVWLDRATNCAAKPVPGGYCEVFLSDASGFVSGEAAQMMSGFWNSPEQLRFGAIPRRDRTIALNFFYHYPTGAVHHCGSLPLANPVYGSFPQWQPQSLPATRQSGDVVVTLEQFSTGHNSHTSHSSLSDGRQLIEFGTNYVNGRNTSVCILHSRSLSDTNQVWQVTSEELSDATGNQIRNTSFGWGGTEQDYITFEPGLWTNELAWKLKCEIKRAKGFVPRELFVLKDVPLGSLESTNQFGWTTNFNGISLTLDGLSRRAPNTNSSWSSHELSEARFTIRGLTNGLHLDLLSARTDDGTTLECPSWGSGGTSRNYHFRNIPVE